jgi:hypothetical protein
VDEHFKLFIGFRNAVCTKLCIWSDGYSGEIKVRSLGQLKAAMRQLVESYNAGAQLSRMQEFNQLHLSEQQFATLIGKCKMYQHLPKHLKDGLYPLSLTDNNIGTITRAFYQDKNFSCDERGSISLWKVYNLFTGANKNSYIDYFIDRNVVAYHFVEKLKEALQEGTGNWFLSQSDREDS